MSASCRSVITVYLFARYICLHPAETFHRPARPDLERLLELDSLLAVDGPALLEHGWGALVPQERLRVVAQVRRRKLGVVGQEQQVGEYLKMGRICDAVTG